MYGEIVFVGNFLVIGELNDIVSVGMDCRFRALLFSNLWITQGYLVPNC